MAAKYPTIETITEAFLSIGAPLIERRDIFMTPNAEKKLVAMGGLNYEKRSGEKVSVLERAQLLATNQDGTIPNLAFLEPTSLILCTGAEAPSILGRWTLVVA